MISEMTGRKIKKSNIFTVQNFILQFKYMYLNNLYSICNTFNIYNKQDCEFINNFKKF